MKRLLTTLVILMGLIGSAGTVWAQDFNKGLKAAQSGDFATALKEWKPLAEHGSRKAQFYLGRMYEKGKGVTQDYAEAVKWYRKAAEQGGVEAQCNLGNGYIKGEGVTQDDAKAVKWYRKAAELGLPVVQFNLGAMYEKGKGVTQDTIAAHMWFDIAAANGNKGAGKERDRVEKMLSAGQLEKANERAERCMDADYKDCEAKAKSWWQKLID